MKQIKNSDTQVLYISFLERGRLFSDLLLFLGGSFVLFYIEQYIILILFLLVYWIFSWVSIYDFSIANGEITKHFKTRPIRRKKNINLKDVDFFYYTRFGKIKRPNEYLYLVNNNKKILVVEVTKTIGKILPVLVNNKVKLIIRVKSKNSMQELKEYKEYFVSDPPYPFHF